MIPKPRVNDIVERCDMSRMFGKVIRKVDNRYVIVRWADGEEHHHIGSVLKSTDTKELIKGLALVDR